jgi:hypothetical protein
MNDDRAIELECQRAVITAEWTMAERKKRQKNEEFVYPNQKEAALKCVEAFQSGITQVCLVAQPGTGKTGASLEIMHLLTTHINDDDCILKENLWILSGMNDKEWAKQYFKNMIKSFREHIHHRGNLMKNKNEISQIQGGLLITDECHIASGKQMTVSKMLREAGLTDMDTIVARKMKMLDISATPEAVSFDLHSPGWRDKSRIIKLEPGPIYKGFQHMLDENRILDAPEILSMEIALQILSMFQTRYEGTTKKYFPFRIRGIAAKGFIHGAITRLGWGFIEHDSSTSDDKNGPKYYDASGEEITKVDYMMLTAPERHTIIFVKEFWRASKRLVRKHVGGSFVSKPKTQNTTAASQDLVARFCDNYNYDGDQNDPNYRPIHYTDKKAIEEYLNWFNHDCNYEIADYTSNRIKSSNGMVTAKPSKVHASNMQNLDSDNVDDDSEEETVVDIRKYRIYSNEETVKSVCKILGYSYRATPDCKIEGPNKDFKLTSLNTKKGIASLESAIKKVPTAYGTNDGVITYRTYYPCYVDPSNKDTLRYVVIIRPTDIDSPKIVDIDARYPSIPYVTQV